MQSRITLDDITDDVMRQVMVRLFMDPELFYASQADDIRTQGKAMVVAILRVAVDNPELLNLVQDFDEAMKQFFSEE